MGGFNQGGFNQGGYQSGAFGASPSSAFPQVGAIWNPEGIQYPYPNFSQPGGIGTPTFPQQSTGELIGLFMSGCGHSFNNWLIEAATDQNGVRIAVILCPLCRFCQRIISPYSDLYTFANDIVFA